MTSWNRVESNCDAKANVSLIFLNSEFLMKVKFPSYVTQRFYLYLTTLKFENLSFIKDSELLNSEILFIYLFYLLIFKKKKFQVIILTNTPLSIWLENFHFEYLKGAHFKFRLFFELVLQKYIDIIITMIIIIIIWKFQIWLFERCSFLI